MPDMNDVSLTKLMANRPPSPADPPAGSLTPAADAVALFHKIANLDILRQVLLAGKGYLRCWTPAVTLMAMILSHLTGKRTLEKMLNLMRSGIADAICLPGKKLSVRLLHVVSTSAYAQARKRLPFPWLRRCLAAQSHALRSMATGWLWRGVEVRVLDGTMITLRPHGRIPKRFPPHRNQHGEAYWCQIRMLASLCLGTGLIVSLIMGNAGDSEQAQAVRLMLLDTCAGSCPVTPASLLWMGDANFGVWRVVAASSQSGQLVLVRLTQPRAKKLAGKHGLVCGMDLAVVWEPSRHDGVDKGLQRQGVAGRLIMVRLERAGFRPHELWWFTTLDKTTVQPAEIAALYARRWKVELSLRYFKTQMTLGEILVKSPAMARRELYTGAMAYNLVRGIMLLSSAEHGTKHGVTPWNLSFTKAREELNYLILKENSKELLIGSLGRIAKGKLPKRRKARPGEPRKKRHRRETFPPLRDSRSEARLRMVEEEQQLVSKS